MAMDDVYALQLHQSYAGQHLINTLYFRRKTATEPIVGDFQTLATAWKDSFITDQTSGLSYVNWIAQQVRGGDVSYTIKQCQRVGGLRFEGQYTGSLVGSGTSEALPPQSSWVTTLYTNYSGRARRGRHYMAGIPEAYQNAGTIIAGFVTPRQTAWNTKVTVYGLSGTDPNWELGIWSMRTATGCVINPSTNRGLVPQDTPSPGNSFTPVTRTTVRSIVYSQRKRTIGVGF